MLVVFSRLLVQFYFSSSKKINSGHATFARTEGWDHHLYETDIE